VAVFTGKKTHSWLLTSQRRYSPVEPGGRKMVHSVLSPARPLEKVVLLKENQDFDGRAVMMSIRVWRDHDGERKPCQVILQSC